LKSGHFSENGSFSLLKRLHFLHGAPWKWGPWNEPTNPPLSGQNKDYLLIATSNFVASINDKKYHVEYELLANYKNIEQKYWKPYT